MKLSELLNDCEVLDWQGPDCDIEKISTRSSEENGGAVFVCLAGEKADAHDFVDEAVSHGAIAIVSEYRLKTPLTQVIVQDTRATLAIMAAKFFGNPAKSLTTIAVVGTNGKTTTAYMIRAILEGAGIPTCLIGTNGCEYLGVHHDIGMTTPDPVEWQGMLATAKKMGCYAVVTEVSAHAIYYKKTAKTIFDIAVFTNFSQDHLDFFHDMQTYAKTKASFFCPACANAAVINVDDSLGLEIAMSTKLKTLTFGVTTPSDVFAINYEDSKTGARFVVNAEDELYGIELSMHGEYNMYNALAALSVGHLMELPLGRMAQSLKDLAPVLGRYQTFEHNGVTIVVDYAHTQDGVMKILRSIAEWATGKIITVLGCGGNRDREKRPLMAHVAELHSDYLIITSDNPRYEEPESITKDMVAGLSDASKYRIVVDRTSAIFCAVNMAHSGDVVAILGKGCEKYMDIGGEKRPYCDLDVVKSLGDSAGV